MMKLKQDLCMEKENNQHCMKHKRVNSKITTSKDKAFKHSKVVQNMKVILKTTNLKDQALTLIKTAMFTLVNSKKVYLTAMGL